MIFYDSGALLSGWVKGVRVLVGGGGRWKERKGSWRKEDKLERGSVEDGAYEILYNIGRFRRH